MGLFSSLKKAAGFELWHGLKANKELFSHPTRALTGAIDPLGTKISNAIFGTKFKPIVDQLGGALNSRYAEYGKDPGLAPTLQGVAHVIAASEAAGGLGLGSSGGQLVSRAASLADSKFGNPPLSAPTDGDVTDTSAAPPAGSLNWNDPSRPLRRFERTPDTLFTDMRNGGDPMKVRKITGVNARAVPVAGPTRVTAPAKTPSPIGTVSSAPKTPPAVNAARSQGLADVRRKAAPRAPVRAVSY
jgi:hypothetical protein